ncbi:sensor histidine kinase [Marinicaulis aureus]|uniref:histidine kinase n=1 Tax=Hyphococcus aureus TaxID=2666033 RepID=A0ABW1KY63_9PROT
MAPPLNSAGLDLQKKPNPLTVFQQTLERDGISPWTARFRADDTERRYIHKLVETTLPTERLLWYTVIFTYLGYWILDVLTISEGLQTVLTMRVIVACAIAALIPLSFVPKVKPHFGWLSAAGIWLSGLSIIGMIAIIPPQGAPPYIIGVLVTFVAASCIMRIPFRVAAAAYISTSAVYLAVLNMRPAFSNVDVISGHFFMLSIAAVAVATSYMQEIRSRMIWLRDEQRKRDNEVIEKLLIEATAADQSKINFLSMMSHELRTPLHQIIGYAEVVSNSFKAANDPGNNARHLSEIHGSAHILLSRIQKMLRFVDATAGKMKYEIVDTSATELVDVAIERMRSSLEKAGIRVETEALKDATLHIDIVHTCYAINNLIENAIHASESGTTLHISGEKLEDGAYELAIRDEGRGMSPEQIEKAMKPFTQSESALVRSREGLGLGLTVAKHIFEDQNATVRLASDGHTGTCAIVRFNPPKAKAEGKPKKARYA